MFNGEHGVFHFSSIDGVLFLCVFFFLEFVVHDEAVFHVAFAGQVAAVVLLVLGLFFRPERFKAAVELVVGGRPLRDRQVAHGVALFVDEQALAEKERAVHGRRELVLVLRVGLARAARVEVDPVPHRVQLEPLTGLEAAFFVVVRFRAVEARRREPPVAVHNHAVHFSL
jgi:hypothetical protein